MYSSITDFEKTGEKFYGNYRAIVKSTADPKKAGRIQAQVYPMFENVADADLPWAIPADPFMGGLANVGSLLVPEQDAHVWVFFEAGDFRFPVYWSGAPAMSGGTPDQPSEGQSGYPHNKVFKTKSGILVELDDSDGNVRIHIAHPSGTDHLIGDDGTVTDIMVKDHNVTITGNSMVTIQGSQTITATGSITITSSGTITIAGSTVAIN